MRELLYLRKLTKYEEQLEAALLYIVNEGRVWDERDTPLTIEQILNDVAALVSGEAVK